MINRTLPSNKHQSIIKFKLLIKFSGDRIIIIIIIIISIIIIIIIIIIHTKIIYYLVFLYSAPHAKCNPQKT